MKKLFLIIALVLPSIALFAYSNAADSISVVQQDLVSLNESQNALLSRMKTLESKVNVLENNNSFCKNSIDNLSQQISVVDEQVNENTSAISTNAESFDAKINSTTESVNNNTNRIRISIIWGIIVIVLVLVISILLTLLLRKKNVSEIKDLKKQADNLNQKIIDRLSDEVNELQTISKSLSNNTKDDKVEDHSLVKAIADRITFMEMTLYKMDHTIRGHRHLSHTIAQMKDNLLAYGYEIVEMLGKPYNDGMMASANFVEDETLDMGKRIISGVIKPQINFNGKMIQTAQITVSQNI